jgi:hypothetical protein
MRVAKPGFGTNLSLRREVLQMAKGFRGRVF